MRLNGWKKCIRYGMFLFLLVLTVCDTARAEAPSDPAREYEEGILSYMLTSSGTDSVQEWLDRDSEALFKQPVEWYFLALYQSGTYDYRSFAKQYRDRIPGDQTKVANATWLNRMMTAWMLGRQADEAEIREHIVPGDIMSLIYGLHFGTMTGVRYADPLLLCERQCEDGGFSLKGDFGDPDVTSMALEALAPYRDENETVSAAAEKAVAYLSAVQLANGGYQSFGADNCESASQVIIALCSLGINPLTDERFQKEGGNPITTLERFRCENGAFSHKEGGEPADITSAEVLCALTAYKRLLAGMTPLYVAEQCDVWAEEPGTQETNPKQEDGKGETGTVTEQDSKEDPSGAETAGKRKTEPYKFIVSAAVILLLILVLFVLKRRKRLTKKNVLCAAFIAAALVVFTFLTKFETVGQHYTKEEQKDTIGSVTLTIRCDTIAGEPGAPADVVILPVTKVSVSKGDTAFDVLNRAAREHRIPMDFTGGGGSVYVKGIAGLYEFAYGSMSGWIYRVNGEIMPVVCGQAEVSPGDEIDFLFTKNLGEDLK